jgi:hypothetical protein
MQARPLREQTADVGIYLVEAPALFAATREATRMSTILLIILVLALLAALPSWPHSRRWGYGPSSVLGVVLMLLLIVVLLERAPI